MLARALSLVVPVVLATMTSVQGDPGRRVVIVVSSDAAPYQQALTGLRRELQRDGDATPTVIMLHGDTGRARDVLQALNGEPPALVVTLGTMATRAVLARVRDVPVVAGMILNPGELGGAGNATGVYLEYPVEMELEWIRRVLPQSRRIGVVYHGAESAKRVERARRVMTVHAIRIDGPSDLPEALQQLANRADVLWGLNDPVVYNPETARALLLFSLRNRIPIVAQSSAWVRAGALYALERDYEDVGAQCAELAARVLAGEAPATLAPLPPRKVRYAVNQRTASELRLQIPAPVLRDAMDVAP